jgi:cell filamentation protein
MSKKRRDRYNTSGSAEAEYVDAAGLVLKNKPGFTGLAKLQNAEEEALARAYRALLDEVRLDTPIACNLICHIHARVFGGLYEWAGRWRTVWISKPGITWPAPDFLASNMQSFEQNVLQRLPAKVLDDDLAFIAAVAEVQGEFLTIHPFREGNARTIKLATDLLAAQTGRPLLVYDDSDDGRRQYVEAAKAAFRRDYALMNDVIRGALAQARQQP